MLAVLGTSDAKFRYTFDVVEATAVPKINVFHLKGPRHRTEDPASRGTSSRWPKSFSSPGSRNEGSEKEENRKK